MNDLDRFGFYTVGDRKTYSKLQAIEWHHSTGQHPQWHFNEVAFSSHDWRQEPAVSLQTLYRDRAQYLRDKYDYLVLFFSGGSDSTNILDTFLDNNIALDECASFWAQNADNDLDSHFSREVSRVAIPRMQQHPHIRHRLIDLSDFTNEVFADQSVKFDWIYFMNSYFSPNNYVRSHLRQFVADYRHLIDQGKSVCFIWGAEKPRLHQIEGRYCVRFQDIVDNSVSPWLQQNCRAGEFDELFYWSPDWVPGIIKQAHVIMNYLKQAPINPVDFTDRQNKYFYGATQRGSQTWYLTADGINHVIYPKWDINTISVGKPRSPVLSQRDDWFFKTMSWNQSAHAFLNGLTKLDQILSGTDAYWKNNGHDLMAGVRGCLGPPYFLE